MRNVSSGICEQQMPKSACASAQSELGLCCPLTKSCDTIECINGEQMPRRDFAHTRYKSESIICACSDTPLRLT